ncbi:uncharacterized protein LOC126741088 [Anthonomus grandis grandis]|uniref:uncharacterized protein LOC126741088 n=1 Tax=Anthonomus grandis grandis TaxID=2921223 RepID=UPI0021662F7C|nr:uncharacterized protein LOC126741088 [Anthonomus grandis grandis]
MIAKISFVAVLVLGVYLSLTPSGATGNLMCYNCTSIGSNSSCSDPLSSDANMTTCADSSEKCAKVTFEVGNNTYWNRFCSNATCDQLKQLAPSGAEISNFECSQCSSDHCNAAGSFGVSLVAVAVALIVSKLF